MRRYRSDTEEAAILRAFAASPRGSLLTPDLLPLTTWHKDQPPEVSRQRKLTRLGNELRRLEARGMIERAGKTPGAWQQGVIQCWRITPAGREQVVQWERHPSEKGQASKVEAATEAERRRVTAERQLLVEHAVGELGPQPSRIQRQQTAIRLHEAGCSYAQIARAFGVSHTCIWIDVGESPYQDGPKRTRRGQFRPPKVLIRRLEKTPLAGLAEVTLTEW